jgi:outer membrane protein OmpA-like peptidoglycan-associated protein
MRAASALLIFFVSGAALAQAVPAIELEHLQPDPAAMGSLFCGNGQTAPQGSWRLGLGLQYSYGHLQTVPGGPSEIPRMLVRDRYDATLTGAVGVLDWLQVDGWVPVIIDQRGDVNGFTPAPAGLGTPFLGARMNVIDAHHAAALSAGLHFGIPIGSSNALGNGGVELMPDVTLGRSFSKVQLGASVQFLIRSAVSLSGATGSDKDAIGSQMALAVMATGIGDGPRGEVTVRAFVPLTGGTWGVEGLVGVRYPVQPLEFYFLLGPGVFGQPNTPSLRVWLGASFGNIPAPHPRCEEGSPYELADCPELDLDGDGVKNGVDKCPSEPEDRDGFEDEDGCPDPDNDHDGLPDKLDRCPLVAGPVENHGCPDVDTDHDGIVDRLDKCPEEPEDKDGFQDEDGCPDLDNDNDGILDVADACPNVPGIPEEHGCPAKDTDGDGVPDHLDNCKAVAGPASNQGCPVEDKQLVVLERTSIKILDKVYFDTGKATLQKRSNLLLDQVARVLGEHPYLKLVQIEGHTDDAGAAEANKKLSQDRAESVKAYLVKKGVAAERLRAMGFGSEKPLVNEKTNAAREANRRVEFNIVGTE